MSVASSPVLIQSSPAMPSSQAVPQADPATSSDAEPKMFELSIFIPRPTFCDHVKFPTHVLPEEPSSPYLVLTLPTQGSETIRELQHSVFELAEGWWLGTFALAAVELDQNGLPDQSCKRTILSEYSELSAAFMDEKFKDLNIRRALEAISIDYNDYSTRFHVIRIRDVLYCQAPGLLLGNLTPFAAYDPTQVGISGGTSIFSTIRGPNPELKEAFAETPESNLAEMATASANKSKKKKGPREPENEQIPSLTSPESDPLALQELANYKFDPTKPFAGFDAMRKKLDNFGNHPPAQYLKTFALSNWNPPPHPLRLRGHYLYLTLTTLECETFQITCHTKGFYINKCTKSQFDPSPRLSTPDSPTPPSYTSLIHLIWTISPLFASQLSQCWNRALTPCLPDFFASISITNCHPAYPWLVEPPKPTSDGIRCQLAYLLTGSATAETLPLARDWADEFAQVRELPRKTLQERTVRERMWNRLQCDFSMAATRGVISCSRGEVPALNSHEPEPCWTYVHNNMLFSRAEDPIGAYEHLGGTAAARSIAGKDLMNIKHLNELDVPGIYTMGSAVIDYHGKRWIAQGMIPGIFRPPDFEAEAAAKQLSIESTQKAHSSNAETPMPNEKDKVADEGADWEDLKKPDADTGVAHEIEEGFSVPQLSTYEILYGIVDIEKPEMGLRSDPAFHKLAAGVAAGFNLIEHAVVDATGKSHQLWLSADVHGIRATDGRCYLIDLYRMTPVDVLFLEKDFNGAILNYDSASGAPVDPVTRAPESVYPHRFTLIRMEAVSAFKTHKFRQFAFKHIQNHQKAAPIDTADSADAILPADNAAKIDNQESEANEVSPENNFVFALNPDACVDRNGLPWDEAAHKDDQSVAVVRELSNFVREQLLPAVVNALSEVKGLPADGRRLSDLLHSHGVNIRYLGHITHRLESIAKDLGLATDNKDDQLVVLHAAVGVLHSEMVFRACKHILNRLLDQTSEAEACYCIAHFLNCLLGASPAIPQDSAWQEKDALWRTYTHEALRTDIVREVRRRYRYALPSAFFENRLASTKLQMLREICTRMGIQLALRDYQLYPPVAEAEPVSGTVTGVETVSPNGHSQSTDDENSADCALAPQATVPSLSKNKKKKKSRTKKAVTTTATTAYTSSQVFSPDDVLNLLPLVRDSTCGSPLANELYAEGRKAFGAGDIALGQELCTDALATYEQVFGAVHPEMCRHWHSLAILYHQISQRMLQELNKYNENLMDMWRLYHAAANESDKDKFKQLIMSTQKERDLEATKTEIDNYIQLAAQNLRQSVIVAERTLGLDHPETIQQYSDLSVMEYSLGNTSTALRYTKHALDLLHIVYGPGCHPDGCSAVTHAGYLAQTTGELSKHTRPESIFELSQVLIGSFFGKSSAKFAEATLVLSQLYAQGSQRELARKYGEEAAKLFSERYGEEHEHTKQAHQLHDAINKSIEVQIKGDEERSARLAKRLGLDPKRAATLRARLLASSAESPSIEHAKASLGRAPAAAATAASRRSYPPNGVNTATIDELVNYIQGPTSKPKMPLRTQVR